MAQADSGTGAPAPTRGSAGHLNSLDGLRGVAAFVVMVAHSAYTYRDSVASEGLLSSLLRAAYRVSHPAVILFFVLSGFVLYVANSRSPVSFGAYLLRRIFRIYPALLFGIVVALALHLIQSPVAEGLGPWTTANWVFPVSPTLVMRHVAMLGILPSDVKLDSVIWSLVIELRFSVVFMVLAWMCRKSPWLLLAVSLGGYAAGLFLLNHLGMQPPYLTGRTTLGALAITLFYLPGFSFGILAAHRFLDSSTGRFLWVGPWMQALAIFAVLAISKVANDDFVWAASFMVIIFCCCLEGPFRRFLSNKVCQFFGRISYSLYLIHFPILMTLTYALHPAVPVVVPVLLAPAISILVATLMYRWVELPGIALGRRAAARLTRCGPFSAGRTAESRT